MDNVRKRLSEFNGIVKENDEIYRNAAKAVGLPDCALWILYYLRGCGTEMNQSNICASIYMPKQTVNSSLKKLEKDGYVELLVGNDRRSRLVRMTQKGQELAARTVDRVIAGELTALKGLTEQEQEDFITLFHKYTELLKKAIPEK